MSVQPNLDRAYFEHLDAADPLAPVADRFEKPEGIVYLDGNSLGPLPNHVPQVVADVVERQWGADLITSWNRHDWWTLARRTGDKVASLIGAPPGSVVIGDGTTVALYKAVGAALSLRPTKSEILTDSGNFPTDLYVLAALADQRDVDLVVVEPDDVGDRIGTATGVLALTEVDYRTGRRHDLPSLTAAAHTDGALAVWDLCHSAGALEMDVSVADLAVGCGYKYLSGGPGAPAFLYVNPVHHADIENPVAGWWGHARPFAMEPEFAPATGIERMQVGTQSILALAALDAALDVFAGVDPAALEAKSRLLTRDFIRLADERLDGFTVVTPRTEAERGSHVSLAHPEAAAIMACLVQAGVIGDVRPPNLLRFGLAPSFQRHVDVWDAVEAIAEIMADGRWRNAPPPEGPVT